jgi:GR25 family glycosyltransferase involved in LPS biosynthesis
MTLNKISEAFFINLDRRKDRLEHINKSLLFSAERFSAVDARSLELSKEVKKLFPKTWNSRSKAEICCAISHYRVWKKLVEDKSSDNFLILEDDVVFNSRFVDFWNKVFSENMPSNYSLIYLGGCQPWNKPHYHKVLAKYNDYFCNIKKNDYFSKDDHFWHMNASSYILSKNAASVLCQWVDQNGIDDAVDNFIQKFFNKNALFTAPKSIYHLNPLMARQLHEENNNTEIDKNSDIRFTEEKFQSVDLKNILYWKHETGSGNFGDELNVPVGKFLFGNSVDFNKEGSAESIRLIGSNLGDIKRGDIVSGVGFHHHTQKIESMGVEFNCVRGPLSLKTLNQQLDEPKDCFLGDPALLLKLFHVPNLREELVDKIGIVPHISNIDYFKKQVGRLDDFYLIDPTNSWEQVVSEIYSCRSIISSSLHGLICSDAYDKPNVWIKVPGQSIPPCDKNSDYGNFKYWDYLLSQGREVKFINNIKDDLSSKLYSGGNKIDLAKMFFAVSGKKLIKNNCFPNLKPISSNQIPKKIHLSWKNKNILDSEYELIKKGAKNLELLNPDWDIEVYDDEDINRLLRDSIGRDNWNLIKDRKITEKTDLWRLLKTYKEGGLYIDIDRYIDTPISEVVNRETSYVLPTFQDVDFSQDFILTCPKNPIVGRAIANNLKYRKQGKPLFFLAVYSYMQSVCEILGTKIIDRGNNPEYFNDIRNKINKCEYLETYRESGPANHILFRNKNSDFSIQQFERDKADFYNGCNVTHWNNDTRNKHESIDLRSGQKLDIKKEKRISANLEVKQQQFIQLKDQWQNFKDYDFLKYVSNQLPKEQSPEGKFNTYNPNQKIAIVSLYTKEISDYAVHSENSIKEYCQKQGYTFYIYREKLEENSSPNWSKAQTLLNHIDDHEYVIWMDSDVLIFNPEKKTRVNYR